MKVFIMIVMVVTGLSIAFYIDHHKEECHIETAIFEGQEIGYLEGCCEDCLILSVSRYMDSEDNVCIWGYGGPCEMKSKTLYFAGEKEELDIEEGSLIDIRWCYIRSIDDHRIRGVIKR